MRRKNDFYPTPSWATEVLLNRVLIKGTIIEPCSGQDHIAKELRKTSNLVLTNDLDPATPAYHHEDAHNFVVNRNAEWIITNPPYNQVNSLVPVFFDNCSKGLALLLRLSFLEPTYDRGIWLSKHPPTQIIVLPRISFTGDGKTDSVTSAWFVWDRLNNHQRIEIIPK